MKERLAELQAVRCKGKSYPSESQQHAESARWYDNDSDTRIMLKKDAEPFMVSYVAAISSIKHNLKPCRGHRLEMDNRVVTKLKEEITTINVLISEIRKNTKELTALHTSALMSTNVSTDDTKMMTALESKTRTASTDIAKRISDLGRDVPKGAVQQRIHSTQLFHVRRSFAEVMERHEAELQRYAKGLKTLVAKQISISKGKDCDGAEVEALLDAGKLNIFVDNYQILEQEAKDMLTKVTQRFDELSKIEKSISEVHDLFIDMAVLVAAQGDVIDSIEAHVSSANYETSAGRKHLKNAKGKQKSARKKKLVLAGIGAATIAMIATVAVL